MSRKTSNARGLDLTFPRHTTKETTMSYVNHLTVLGAGVLGGHISWHSAFKGKSVVVYDISEEALARCRAAQAHYAAIYQTEAVGASEADVAGARQRLTLTTPPGRARAHADPALQPHPHTRPGGRRGQRRSGHRSRSGDSAGQDQRLPANGAAVAGPHLDRHEFVDVSAKRFRRGPRPARQVLRIALRELHLGGQPG